MDVPKETLKISPGVHWVGVKDWDRQMFDRLIPLPEGTSYNAYLVQGEEKTVLIDSVNPGFEEELEAKVEAIADPSEIDYIVMNHAEPDHANAISHMLSLANDAEVLSTEKGRELAQSLHHIPEDRVRVVEDGETLDLGGKTLKFVHAPWLHWPETMLTYYEEEGVLFPCDFFGCHLATGKFYDEELGDDLLSRAKEYYGEIMMPFQKMVSQALDKIEKLDVAMIAPSHGPIYKNPDTIIDRYRKWSSGETVEKILVVYTSMWGSTEEIAKAIVETIADEGVEVESLNLASVELGRLARGIVDSRGIIVGTPIIHGGAHPEVHKIVHLLGKLNPPTKYLGVVESYGWGGTAVPEFSDMLSGLDAEVLGSVRVKGSPEEEDIQEIVEFGREFAEEVRSK